MRWRGACFCLSPLRIDIERAGFHKCALRRKKFRKVLTMRARPGATPAALDPQRSFDSPVRALQKRCRSAPGSTPEFQRLLFARRRCSDGHIAASIICPIDALPLRVTGYNSALETAPRQLD